MPDKPKKPATTISLREYQYLERENASNEERAREYFREREDAKKRAETLQRELDETRIKLMAESVRASRAEGYAQALLAQTFPQRPKLPWEQSAVDQWGNPLYR